MGKKRFSGMVLSLLTACAAYITPEGAYIEPLPGMVVVGPPVFVASPPSVVVQPLSPVLVVPRRPLYFYGNLYYDYWDGL